MGLGDEYGKGKGEGHVTGLIHHPTVLNKVCCRGRPSARSRDKTSKKKKKEFLPWWRKGGQGGLAVEQTPGRCSSRSLSPSPHHFCDCTLRALLLSNHALSGSLGGRFLSSQYLRSAATSSGLITLPDHSTDSLTSVTT